LKNQGKNSLTKLISADSVKITKIFITAKAPSTCLFFARVGGVHLLCLKIENIRAVIEKMAAFLFSLTTLYE